MQIILMQRPGLICPRNFRCLKRVMKVSSAFVSTMGVKENQECSSMQGLFSFRATGIVEGLHQDPDLLL